MSDELHRSLARDVQKTVAGTHDLWHALRTAVPGLAEEVQAAQRGIEPRLSNFPGLRAWLVAEFAMATPTRVLVSRLQAIHDDMVAEGISEPWPALNMRTLNSLRSDLADDWMPVREQIEVQIRNVGVVNKNRRLLALQQLAEQLAEDMYDERDEKNGRLYLIPEYRMTLKAIAEEVGELGQQIDERDGTIRGLVEMLSKALDISGMGVQKAEEAAGTEPYDYHREVVDIDFVVREDAQDA